jgi:hypothetical protein
VYPREDKGSTVKGNDTLTALAQDQQGLTKESNVHLHNSIHTPRDVTLAHQPIDPNQPQGSVYYYDLEQYDWMHRKPYTPDHHQHKKVVPQGHSCHEVDYLWDDCPWTLQEIEAFNPFPSPPLDPPNPPKMTFQTFNPLRITSAQTKPHPPLPNAHTYHQFTSQNTPNTFHQPNPFHNQLQFHKAIAKGPKLSFPEFEGIDPDGWIIKAEKYFELVGVANEDRVQLAVLYIKGKAEYW